MKLSFVGTLFLIFSIVYSLEDQQIFAQGTKVTQPSKRLNKSDDTVFKISDELKFENLTIKDSIRKSDIDKLLSSKIPNGSGAYGVELTNASDKKKTVYTCQQWRKELSKGFYAFTTYDMAMQSGFIYQCDFLYSLKNAAIPKQRVNNKPWVGLSNFNLIPAEILTRADLDNIDLKKVKGKTIQQFITEKQVEIIETLTNQVSLVYLDMKINFWEVARADFDRDGFEDIWVAYHMSLHSGGTMRHYGNMILSRRKSSNVFRVKLIPSFYNDK